MLGVLNHIKEVEYNFLSGIRNDNSGREVPARELWTTRFMESRGIKASFFASDRQTVIDRVKEIGSRRISERKRFCCLVSRHGNGGHRSSIAVIVGRYGEVDYGGRFRNNTDELKRVFRDGKISFLRQYKFNICPKNSDSDGYATEKLENTIKERLK